MKNYGELVVWQRSVDFVPKVYEVLTGFPPEERFAIVDQIRRSAVSVPANIAEGQARQHTAEFVQHLAIARGSLAELHTLLIIAHRLGYLDDETLAVLEEDIVAIRKPLFGLVSKLRSRTAQR